MRNVSLFGLAVALGVMECGSAFVIWIEDYADAQPLFAVAFAALFLTGAALVRSGRSLAGAVLVGALCVFELVSFPGWERKNAFDWITQPAGAALALAGLIAAIATLVARQRARVSS